MSDLRRLDVTSWVAKLAREIANEGPAAPPVELARLVHRIRLSMGGRKDSLKELTAKTLLKQAAHILRLEEENRELLDEVIAHGIRPQG